MALWTDHDLEEKIVNVLGTVPLNNPQGHHFGAPYVSSYQIAILLERDYSETVLALDMRMGGVGTGQHDSLSQYIGRELSLRIRRADEAGEHYPVQGAFFSNIAVENIRLRRTTGEAMVSSLVGSSYDMGMFRLT